MCRSITALRVVGILLLPFIGCGDSGQEGCENFENLCEGVDCDDGNDCTFDECLHDFSSAFCLNSRLENGTPCTRNNIDGVCVDGVCDLCEETFCEPDDNACTADCNPETGTCDYIPLKDGTKCDDGDDSECLEDVCIGGACTGDGAPVICNDGNPCTEDTCQSLEGCIFATVEDGTLCNMYWMCTGGECVNPCDPSAEEVYPCPILGFEDQLCCPGSGTCTDAYNCGRSYCDPTVEEAYPCPVGGLEDLICCPDAFRCQDVCCHGDEDCDDGNECTEYACADGLCQYTAVADGTACGINRGICQAGSCVGTFPCTEQGLRDAIAVGGGPHTFDCGGSTTVVTQATVELDNDVILDGGGNLTIDGNDDHCVFSVESYTRVELHGFMITGGLGGGIRSYGTLTLTNSTVSGNRTEYSDGGGIWTWTGTLTLINSAVSGNTAGGSGDGGGLATGNPGGVLTLINSTISGNRAQTGGGIWNGWGTLTLINTTVSGNQALIYGGGIYNFGTLTLTNSTVSGNTAGDDGGGVSNEGALVTLTNSTISGNTAASGSAVRNHKHWSIASSTVAVRGSVVDGDCVTEEGATTVSNGYNIESPGDTCGFNNHSVSAEDLKLGRLADNGGPTMTHALLPGSAAIDQIPEADCVDADGEPLTTDQRGEPRPAGDGCDVGAFEVQP